MKWKRKIKKIPGVTGKKTEKKTSKPFSEENKAVQKADRSQETLKKPIKKTSPEEDKGKLILKTKKSALPAVKQKPDKIPKGTVKAKAKQTFVSKSQRSIQFLRSKSDPKKYKIVETDKKGNKTIKRGVINYVSLNDIKKTEKGKYKTRRDTRALESTTKEVKPGCFIIDNQTEAGFCPTCLREGDKNDSVLFTFLKREDFKDALKDLLGKVKKEKIKRVHSKTVISGNAIEKICSPEISLNAIIRNFNDTCPGYKFKKFFKTMYCESCKKGIPPEVTMAMMSIESGGNCPATLKADREESTGILQINSKVHQCRDHRTGRIHEKNTKENLQCFKNPINNINKSIEILSGYYSSVNNKKTPQCKPWLKMTNEERDGWRRGVSAYNGGPMWTSRAIESARDKRTLKGTEYLKSHHRRAGGKKYKKDDASWEKLRMYYFIEKLSQGVKANDNDKCTDRRRERGTGRKISCTISNLAHTEAVLGRNVKSSSPSMVDIWSQYIKKKKNKVSCKKK